MVVSYPIHVTFRRSSVSSNMAYDVEAGRKRPETTAQYELHGNDSSNSSYPSFDQDTETDESEITLRRSHPPQGPNNGTSTQKSSALQKTKKEYRNLRLRLRYKFTAWQHKIRSYEETGGIDPIPPNQRQSMDASSDKSSSGSIPFQMMLLWFSMTLATNNIIIGSLGTMVFRLSFVDAALCAVFGLVLGGVGVGYMSTWGPRSGGRTLVFIILL